MDLESLASLRRSFHTLKGSGRMVGARLIAEFSWAIENLLNRIIDKTLSRTPAMMALLRNAVAALPQLVHQLEHGGEVSIEPLMSRAFAYADGREADQAPPCRRGSRRCDDLVSYRGLGDARVCRADVWSRRSCRRRRPLPRRRPPPRRPLPLCRRSPRTWPPWIRSCTRSTAKKSRAIWPRFATICASAPACRRRTSAGVRVSRHSYAERQLQDGRGAPRHPHHRAAQPLHAQSIRQRPRHVGCGARGAFGRGARHRQRRIAHQ